MSAFAAEAGRKHFGKGNPFTVEELPASTLKEQLLGLPPEARAKAMRWLHRFDFAASDAVHLRASKMGDIYYICPDDHVHDHDDHAHAHDDHAHDHATQPSDKTGKPVSSSDGTANATTADTSKSNPPIVEKAAVAITSPPAYHSRPGASRVIYLDFNGGVVTGTAWNSSEGVASWDVQVWSQDGDFTTFNDAEQTWMRRVWERVSEDYAPFDVNVTTDYAYDPVNTGGQDNVGWLMICTTTDKNGVALPHAGSGGVAYVGVFGEAAYSPNYQPAWVTSTNGGGNEATVAEAASHEMGHNMGLSHDGTSSLTYYGGHGTGDISWGPIMGTGYGRNVSQWSKGEYYNANMFQDDLAIISARVPYAADDVGNTNAAATVLVPSGSGGITKAGLIGTTNDVDVFSFSTGAGTVTLNATPYICDADTKGGNLDILLELYDTGGNLITSNNPATTTTAGLSLSLGAGTYFLHVKPVGAGTPTVSSPTGYTVYGSLGRYTIAGTIILPGVGVTESGGSTNVVEGGATDSYTLVLGTAPTANVVVNITPNAQVSVDKTSVTFTTANWNTPQTVTVTAVNDTNEEGPHTGLITHTATSSDSTFNGIGVASVIPNITDNDVIILTTPNGGETWIAGSSWTITWNSLLGGNVKLDLLKNGVFFSTITASTPNDGSHVWTISPSVTAGTNYRVRITSVEFPTKSDTSAADFTIQRAPLYYANMDTNPGWTFDTGWAYGVPTGANQDAIGKPDPTAGYNGANVFGYNLAGDYAASLSATRWAKTPVINCTGYTNVTLSFRRWLGVEGFYDKAYLEVSRNNTNWTRIWSNSNTQGVDDDDGAWVLCQYDISAVADNQSTVYVRWGLGTTDSSWNFSGWNLDEVIVDGTPPASSPGVTVTQSGGTTNVSEGGATDTYTLVLTSAPTANVTITVTPDAQLSVSPSSLVFTTANWSTPQTVTVTAVNDALHEFTHTGSIVHAVTSTDGNYNGLAVEGLLATITDNDNIAPVVNAGPDQTVPLVSSGWSPLSLSPTAWFDASNAASITSASGAVSQWNDLSGNNHHLVQATSTNRPATGTVTINGLNAIDFDGSTDKLAMSSNPFSPTINDALVIMVHRVESVTAAGTLFSLSGTETTGNRWQSHTPWSDGTLYFDVGGASGANRVSTAYGASVNSVVLISFYGSTTNGVQEVYKNGTLLVSDATGHAVTTAGNPVIGGVGNYQNTSIAEVLMIKGTVTSTARRELEGYLAHKWGLVSNLPVGHPYKSSPPNSSIATANLDGTVSDGNSDPLTTSWTLVSGPAPITLANAAAVDTTATFTATGVYTFKLEANDTYGPISDNVVITVVNGTAPTVTWTTASQSSTNESGTMTVTAQLSATSGQTVTVPFTVTGTASGADYTITSSPITIASGATSGTATITITADTLDEVNETVVLTMGTPTNATLGGTTIHTATITDDDTAPSVAFSATTSSGSEATTAVTLPVALSAASGQTVTVDYAITGGSATGGGVDYTLASGTLTFTAGSTVQNIAMTVVNDLLDEANETIQVTLNNPTNATLGANTLHTYTITDNDATPSVAFSATSSSGSEATTAVNLPVALSAASGQTVTVAYAVTGGTASGSGVDYTLANGTLTFTPGTTTQNIAVTVVNDVLNEANETIQLILSSPTNATLGTNTAHTYTITDNDSGLPSVAWTVPSQSSIGESGTVTVTAQLSLASGQNVTVPFTVSGTATGADYTITASPITILAGATTGSATITITSDVLDETDETVVLTMGTPTNATLGATTIHTATITDDDATPSVAFSATSSSGSEATTAVSLAVALSAASGQTVTVGYAISGGTATGGGVDYTLASGTLTFTPGTTTQDIAVTVVNDLLNEISETIQVTLSSPTNATLGANTLHTYTITDNDATPSVAFSATSSSGSEATTAVNLPVALSAASGQTVTVAYAVTGGTANGSGVDYTLASGTLTYSPGTTTQNIAVTVVNDLLNEISETIQVTLSGPTNATLGTNTLHTYTITDNDATPSVAFSATTSSGSEAATSVTLPVVLSAASGQTITVVYTVTGGTATGGGVDYTLASGALTFTPGTTTQNIAVTVVNDVLNEANETIQVTLSNPVNAALGANTAHTYTITDNDSTLPNVTWSVASQSSAGESGSMTVTAQLNVASGQTVTVPFSVTGTATGTDYTITASPITIAAGATTGTATIAITSDVLDETNETVILTMGTPTNATLGAITAHTATITDDDATPSLAFSATSSSGSEATTSVTLPVVLSAVSGQAVNVDYTVTGGTATGGGVDYTLASGTLTFSAGMTTRNIAVTIVDDVLSEANETILVTLSNPVNASMGGNTVHTYTITDNDSGLPNVEWSVANQSSAGESGTMTVTAQLNTASGQTVTVPFTVSGTASGADYTITASPITITAGATTGTATITITADTLDETNETVVLTLGTPTNASLGATTVHTATITDDDATPTVAFSSTSSSGSEATTGVTLAVALSAVSGQTITVGYSVTGGTATGSGVDYTLASGTLTFTAGVTTQDIAVTIANDVLDEADETIEVTLNSPANATLGANTAHTYTITDNDASPSVAWSVPSQASASESGTMTVTAQVSQVSGQTVTVPFSITGTASGADYTITASPITIAAGATTGTATITITADTLDETAETVVLTIGAPTNATLGATTIHTATITDDDATPSVAFSSTSSSGSESTTAVTLPVTLSTASGQTVTVAYAVTGGTATGGGVDYTLASGTLTFTAGTTTQDIAVTVVDDLVSEANKTIQVTLSSPGNATLGTNTVHTYTIIDDDSGLPTVEWSVASQASANESGTMTVTAQLSGISGQTVTVPFTVSGSATGADYAITASPITIAVGDTTGTATITITADTLDEADETVVLTIGTPTNATLGTTTVHTATITDDDATPSVAFSATTSSGSEATTAVTLPVALSAASGQTVTVAYAVTGGTASGGGVDYTLASGTLTFTPGTTTQNIAVTVVNDILDEVNETIQVTLSSPANATLGTNTAHTYTITDNDATPSVAFSAITSSGSEATTAVALPVALSAASGQTVTVDYAVTGGTASGGGVDYTLASGTLTFTPGTTIQNIAVAVVNDTLDEVNETIQVTLSSPANATLGTNTAHTYTITDNDATPSVAFSSTSSSGSEATTAVTLAVALSAASGQTVTVAYAVTGGTANGGGVDYTLASGTLTFTPGTTTQNIAVTVVNDALSEANETIQVTLSSPTNATLVGNTIHTYTITDDDTGLPNVTWTVANQSSGGESGIMTVTALLSAASGQPVTVPFSVTGTASGADYTITASPITITAGATTGTATITITTDTLDEADETVILNMGTPTNATLGAITEHTATITDDDATPKVAFSRGSSSGSEATTPVTLAVVLSAANGQAITVDYAVTGGTATGAGQDYTLTSGKLTFNPGSMAQNIALTVVDDVLSEPNETIRVTLSNPVNVTLGTNTNHTYTIVDNDSVTAAKDDNDSKCGMGSGLTVFLLLTLTVLARLRNEGRRPQGNRQS